MSTRVKLGLITIVLLAVALGIWLFGGKDSEAIGLACLRMAIVLAAAWMAHPQLSRLPRWMIAATAAVALVAAIKPKALIVGLPLLAALYMLRPRSKQPARR